MLTGLPYRRILSKSILWTLIVQNFLRLRLSDLKAHIERYNRGTSRARGCRPVNFARYHGSELGKADCPGGGCVLVFYRTIQTSTRAKKISTGPDSLNGGMETKAHLSQCHHFPPIECPLFYMRKETKALFIYNIFPPPSQLILSINVVYGTYLHCPLFSGMRCDHVTGVYIYISELCVAKAKIVYETQNMNAF